MMRRIFIIMTFGLLGVGYTAGAATLITGVASITLENADPAFPTSGGEIRIGDIRGGGSITVDDGTVVELSEGSDPSARVSGADLNVGRRGPFASSLSIEGVGSRVQLNGADFSPVQGWIGRDGATGQVTIRDGGALAFVNTQTYVEEANEVGAQLAVGAGVPAGFGALTIENGTLLLSSNQFWSFLWFGREEGTTGTGRVSGPSSEVALLAPNGNARMTVAQDTGSFGSLIVDEGATVTVSGDDSLFIIASSAGSTGVTIVADGSEVIVSGATRGSVQVGAAFADFGKPEAGNGTLIVTGAGSTVSASGSIIVGSPLAFGGGPGSGALIVSDSGNVTAPVVYVGEGGILSGDGGSISGDVIVDGGVVAPGTSPGVMSIFGDLNVVSGMLQFEIVGPTVGLIDQLFVSGDLLTPSGLSIEIRFLDGYVPASDATFDILSIGGAAEIFATPDLIDLSILGLAGASGFDISIRNGMLSLAGPDFGSPGGTPAPVPLPAGAALLATGLMTFGAVRRRKIRCIVHPT